MSTGWFSAARSYISFCRNLCPICMKLNSWNTICMWSCFLVPWWPSPFHRNDIQKACQFLSYTPSKFFESPLTCSPWMQASHHERCALWLTDNDHFCRFVLMVLPGFVTPSCRTIHPHQILCRSPLGPQLVLIVIQQFLRRNIQNIIETVGHHWLTLSAPWLRNWCVHYNQFNWLQQSQPFSHQTNNYQQNCLPSCRLDFNSSYLNTL